MELLTKILNIFRKKTRKKSGYKILIVANAYYMKNISMSLEEKIMNSQIVLIKLKTGFSVYKDKINYKNFYTHSELDNLKESGNFEIEEYEEIGA